MRPFEEERAGHPSRRPLTLSLAGHWPSREWPPALGGQDLTDGRKSWMRFRFFGSSVGSLAPNALIVRPRCRDKARLVGRQIVMRVGQMRAVCVARDLLRE